MVKPLYLFIVIRGFSVENHQKIAEEIACISQLASILEVSSYPKPGTVHRLYDFKDTKFEHFILSGIAIGPIMKQAALKGFLVAKGKISLQKVEVGKYIKQCVVEAKRWYKGGNTNLGIVTLLVPLTVAAGMFKAEHKKFNKNILCQNVWMVLKSTTYKDTIHFYEAVKLAKVGGLGKLSIKESVKAPDVTSKKALKEIARKKISLYNVMKLCSSWDNLCKEWVTGMHITFNVGFPTIKKVYMETGDLNKAIVQCFLTILATYPDSLIARKNGLKTAKKISETAKKILKMGGVLTKEGYMETKKFDVKLRTPDNRLNPGTTADLTASSIMVSLFSGIKP